MITPEAYLAECVRAKMRKKLRKKKEDEPRAKRIFSNPKATLRIWASSLWILSEGVGDLFIDHIKEFSTKLMPDGLEDDLLELLEDVIEFKKSKFARVFVTSLIEKWPSLPKELTGLELSRPSLLALPSNFAKQEIMRMDFGTKDPNCYHLWPTLIALKHPLDFVKKLGKQGKLQISLQDMQAACISLMEQQKRLFATEHDREILFYFWLNNNFCRGTLSCVVPQVDVGSFTANGIILDARTAAANAINLWRGVDCTESPGSNLIICIVTEAGVEYTSEKFLKKSKDMVMGSWLCVIESKKDENMLILAQAGGYFYHFQKGDIQSNIPMFLIGMSGTSIKFGVGIRFGVWIYVSELRTFSLQSRVTGEVDFREMAAYLLVFRHLMTEAGDARRKLSEVGNYHVDPLCDDPLYSGYRIDNPEDFRFPPRRHFQINGEEYVISKITKQLKSEMFSYMCEGIAERVSSMAVDGASEQLNIVIRYDSRYGSEAHFQLYDAGVAPQLYTAEKCHSDYDDVYFIVMEQLDLKEYECLHNLILGWKSSRRILAPCEEEEARIAITKNLRALKDILEEKSVVHGDLRPTNIFVSRSSQRLKILDFEFGTVTAGKPTKYPLTLNVDMFQELGCSSRDAALRLRNLVISHQQDERMIDYCISRVDALPSGS